MRLGKIKHEIDGMADCAINTGDLNLHTPHSTGKQEKIACAHLATKCALLERLIKGWSNGQPQ